MSDNAQRALCTVTPMVRPDPKSLEALYFAWGYVAAANGNHENPCRRDLVQHVWWQRGHDAYVADRSNAGTEARYSVTSGALLADESKEETR